MGRPESRRGTAWITGLVGGAVIAYLVFHSTLALGGEDVDRYESPLMLSVGRQLIAGPWGLYGPFGGSNRLVLIHAPLYYRVAAGLAWPMARAGLHPVTAALVAGRLISALSLAAAMAAAYRLGRLGGLPRRAGWWSALLVGGSPILGGLPFAVRPDMAGVALQGWGVVLALESLDGDRRRLGWASVLFGLAACVKQHLVAGWAVSAGLSAWECVRGRRAPADLAAVVVPGLAVSAAVYGVEWVVTEGRVWDAAFVAAANVGRVHPGDWLHVGTVVAAIVGNGAGLAALAVSGAAVRRVGSRRSLLVGAGLLVVAIASLTVAQLVSPAPWITAMLPALAMAGLAIAVPGCAAPVGRSSPGDRIDARLGIYGGAEILLLVVLCRSSSGAWINYGIPAMMFVAVLAARSLAGAVDRAPWLGRAIAAVAAIAVLASVLMDARVEVNRRRAEQADLRRVFSLTGLPPPAVYFADRPGLNRMSGRLEWVFDDWLYPAFESRKLAEPRARWLRSMLGPRSTVRAVALESDGDHIDGLPESLRALGFEFAGRSGRFRVWIHEGNPPGKP